RVHCAPVKRQGIPDRLARIWGEVIVQLCPNDGAVEVDFDEAHAIIPFSPQDSAVRQTEGHRLRALNEQRLGNVAEGTPVAVEAGERGHRGGTPRTAHAAVVAIADPDTFPPRVVIDVSRPVETLAVFRLRDTESQLAFGADWTPEAGD